MGSIPITYSLIAFNLFYDEVLPEIPGYVPSLVDQMIRESCIEFCRRTRIWKGTVIGDIVTNDPSYALTPATQAVIHEVRRVSVSGKDLGVFSPDEKDGDSRTWRSTVGPASDYYAGYDEDEIFIFPLPDADIVGGLEADLVFMPARACTQVPDFLYERHSAVIAKGAKYRLMAMGKKPWTDRQLSVAYERDVEIAIGSLGANISRGRTRNPLRVTTHHGVK